MASDDVKTLPFELVGGLPGPWKEHLGAFSAAAVEHPWDGQGLQRLVITTQLREDLERWMTAERFDDWEEGYRQGRSTKTGAIASRPTTDFALPSSCRSTTS
jgi:hypothetical protein